jgi:cobalt-zinc-cadmium efflux system protein
MGHDHSHQHQGSKNILLAFFLNASFSVIELIGGYLTNSMAIYSDALHDFGDSLALLFAYFAEKLSHKKEDRKFTFGYRRFSTLAALINGLILLAGSTYVIYESIIRIQNPEPVKPEGMIALAILGIAVNGFAAYRLSKEEGANPKMVMYHLLEDLLGWVSVFIVSIILLFWPWYILDSILSILISLVILRGVYKNILKVGMIFMQNFPSDIDLTLLKKEVVGLDLVEDIHEIKGWSVDGDSHYLRFHVQVNNTSTIVHLDALKKEIKLILKNYKVSFSTIEFEAKCNHVDE